MCAWLGLHVFYHDLTGHDALLINAIGPFIRELRTAGKIDGWFFIRYWHGGPHLRVRLHGDDAILDQWVKPRFIAHLNDYMERYPARTSWEREAFYQAHAGYRSEDDAGADLPWYPNHSVQEIPYSAEVNRYGGAEALPLGEALFRSSSDLAIRVLGRTGGQPAVLLGAAADIMLSTLTVMEISAGDLPAFLEHYGLAWSGFAPDMAAIREKVRRTCAQQAASLQRRITAATVVGAGEGRASAHPVYGEWHRDLYLVRRGYADLLRRGALRHPWEQAGRLPEVDAISSVVFSHLHMTNNRLGLSPTMECFLGLLLASAMREATLPA